MAHGNAAVPKDIRAMIAASATQQTDTSFAVGHARKLIVKMAEHQDVQATICFVTAHAVTKAQLAVL